MTQIMKRNCMKWHFESIYSWRFNWIQSSFWSADHSVAWTNEVLILIYKKHGSWKMYVHYSPFLKLPMKSNLARECSSIRYHIPLVGNCPKGSESEPTMYIYIHICIFCNNVTFHSTKCYQAGSTSENVHHRCPRSEDVWSPCRRQSEIIRMPGVVAGKEIPLTLSIYMSRWF